MRVILDTNVLLSGLLSPFGVVDAIHQAWQKRRFQLVTSNLQIEELRHASRYAKFKSNLQPHRVGKMVNDLRRSIVLDRLLPLPEGMTVTDPNDAFLLAMALTAGVDWLVTGDHRAGLLQQHHIERTRIVTPRYFCSHVLE